MIFKPELVEKILAGEKTVTRRPVKLAERHCGCSVERPCRYEVGKDYALQPGRGKKAVARIRILDVRREHVGRIDANDARREGFKTAGEFRRYWTALYGSYDPAQMVDRIAFELLPFYLLVVPWERGGVSGKNVVKFECPKCGAQVLAETAGGSIDVPPLKCAFGHPVTEMEQRLIESEATA